MIKFLRFIHIEEKTLEKLINWTFVVFILSVPFSYAYSLSFLEENKTFTSFPFYNVFLIDIAALILVVLAILNSYWHKKSILALFPGKKILFPVFAILSLIWSGSAFLSFFWGVRLLIIILSVSIAIRLIAHKAEYKNLFLKLIIAGGVIESLIALAQFLFQRSIGLYYLGEAHLGSDVLGLARVGLFGKNLIRAYGTFPHPNILGGFLLFAIVATIWCKPTKNYKLILLTQLLGLGLTFSRSAILGLILIFLLNWKNFTAYLPFKSGVQRKSILITILVLLFGTFLLRSPLEKIINGTDPSTRLRLEYAAAAYNRFIASPILGRGWGTGPIELSAFSKFPFYSWEMQPVHNIFLLVLSDLGILGLMVFLYFIYSSLNKKGNIWKYLFIAYLFIGLLDHYFLTLPQGIFIFFASAWAGEELEQKKEKIPKLK